VSIEIGMKTNVDNRLTFNSAPLSSGSDVTGWCSSRQPRLFPFQRAVFVILSSWSGTECSEMKLTKTGERQSVEPLGEAFPILHASITHGVCGVMYVGVPK